MWFIQIYVGKKNIIDNNKKRRFATFYYLFGPNETSKPLIPTNKTFQVIYDRQNHRSLRSATRCSSPNNVEAILDNNTENDTISTEIPSLPLHISVKYFDSKDARNLFNPSPTESVEWAIQRRLNIFEEILNNPSKVVDVIEDSHELKTRQQGILVSFGSKLFLPECWFNSLKQY